MLITAPEIITTSVPDDIADYGVLTASTLDQSVFRFGAPRIGIAMGRDREGAVYLRGHELSDEACERFVRALFAPLARPEQPQVARVAVLFTAEPFDGREKPPRATWCSTVVAADTPGAVDTTVVRWPEPDQARPEVPAQPAVAAR
jgi:hypothetical protein